ncbi:MAG: HigA family addiction module antitoxin [Polyangiaceae bacterium]
MMIKRDPNRMGVPVHPGEVLLEDFLRPLGLSQAALARHLDVSLVRVKELVKGKRGVSAETAWLLAQIFGTTPQFWVNEDSADAPRGEDPTGELTMTFERLHVGLVTGCRAPVGAVVDEAIRATASRDRPPSPSRRRKSGESACLELPDQLRNDVETPGFRGSVESAG